MIVVVATDHGYRLAELLRPGLVRLEGIDLAVPTTSYARLDKYTGPARATVARAITWRPLSPHERPRA